MADIFISYAREDIAKARTIAKELEARGWSVFWDRRIPHGQDFNTYLQKQIDAAWCIVVLWSRAATASQFVRDEAAEGLNGRLIPILIESVKQPLGFRQLEAADLSDWAGEETHEEFTDLVSSIQALAQQERAGRESAERAKAAEEERARREESERVKAAEKERTRWEEAERVKAAEKERTRWEEAERVKAAEQERARWFAEVAKQAAERAKTAEEELARGKQAEPYPPHHFAEADTTEHTSGWVGPLVGILGTIVVLQVSNIGFSPLLRSIQRDFPVSNESLSLFAVVSGLAAIIVSVPAGMAATRFGEKPMLIAGLLGVAAGNVLIGTTTTFLAALFARGVTVVGHRVAFVCALVAAVVTCPPSHMGRTMGLVGATWALTSFGAPLLANTLESTLGWRTVMFAYAGVALIGSLYFALSYRRGSATNQADIDPSPAADRSATSRTAFTTPVVWLVALLAGLGAMGTQTWFVRATASAHFGLGTEVTAWISLGLLCAFVASLAVGVLSDRYEKWKVVTGLFAVLTAASASLIVENPTVFIIGTTAILSLQPTVVSQLYGIAGTVARGRETARAMGIVSFGAALLGYFGQQMLSSLFDVMGQLTAVFCMLTVVNLLAFFIMTVRRRSAGLLTATV